MPKRNLRIVKRIRNVPVLGICECCNARFLRDPNMGNAQSAGTIIILIQISYAQ